MTAAELIAELEADPEYQRKRREADEKLERRAALHRAASAPVLADLAEVGYELESVWDLVNTSEPYPDALPVLADHVQRDYPSRVKEGIARALAVKPAAFAWPVLVDQFKMTDAETAKDAKDGLAVALDVTVTLETGDEFIDLVLDERHGSSRILMLDGLKRLGSDRAVSVLNSLVDHPVLGKEATATVTGRRRDR
jgi:hypothetical protein